VIRSVYIAHRLRYGVAVSIAMTARDLGLSVAAVRESLGFRPLP
jgi:hypothetical protein